MQGVVVKSEVDEETFKLAKDITQESSLYVTGTITEDNRSDLGYEMQVKSIEVIHEAHDYPITPKNHGTEFLMDHRHLWLRSKKQHAVMKIRNEIIRATYEFFNENGFTKIDPPILTASAPKVLVNYSILNTLIKMHFYLKVVNYIWKLQLWHTDVFSHLDRHLERKNLKQDVI